MRKLLIVLSMIGMLLVSCKGEDPGPGYYTLLDLEGIDAPGNDIWIITDEDGSQKFQPLREKLDGLKGSGRQITVILPNMTRFPGISFATFSYGGQRLPWDLSSLVSVQLPRADTIGQWAFYGTKGLQSVLAPEAKIVYKDVFNRTGVDELYLPKVQTIYGSLGPFLHLKQLTLATQTDKPIEVNGGYNFPVIHWWYGYEEGSQECELTIGKAEAAFVEGNYYRGCGPFKSIRVVE